MRSLGQLILDLCMLVKLAFQLFHLLLKLVVLVCQLLDVLRLVLQLTRELQILVYRQLGGPLQLVLIHVQHLHLDISDVHEHLLPQLVDSCSPFFRNDTKVLLVPLTTSFKLILKCRELLKLVFLLLHPSFDIIELVSPCVYFRDLLLLQDYVICLHFPHDFVMFNFHLLLGLLLFVDLLLLLSYSSLVVVDFTD